MRPRGGSWTVSLQGNRRVCDVHEKARAYANEPRRGETGPTRRAVMDSGPEAARDCIGTYKPSRPSLVMELAGLEPDAVPLPLEFEARCLAWGTGDISTVGGAAAYSFENVPMGRATPSSGRR